MKYLLLSIGASILAVGVAYLLFLAVSLLRVRLADRKFRKTLKETPWKPYVRPRGFDSDQSKHERMSIGVERVTEDGLILNRVEMYSLDINDTQAQLQAEGEAIARATSYNSNKVGM